jgi:hypothetical protein
MMCCSKLIPLTILLVRKFPLHLFVYWTAFYLFIREKKKQNPLISIFSSRLKFTAKDLLLEKIITFNPGT